MLHIIKVQMAPELHLDSTYELDLLSDETDWQGQPVRKSVHQLVTADGTTLWTIPFKRWGLKFTALGDSVIRQASNGSQYQTSYDGDTWTDYTPGDEIILSTGQVVYWRAKSLVTTGVPRFLATGYLGISGSVMSLVYGEKPSLQLTSEHQFDSVFKDLEATIVTEGLLLPAKDLTPYCYAHMFENCNFQHEKPEEPGQYFNNQFQLPANVPVAYCYASMFAGTTNLWTAPTVELWWLQENCLESMCENSSVTYVSVYMGSWDASSATNWLANTAPWGDWQTGTGIMYGSTDLEAAIPHDNDSGLPSNWVFSHW